MRMLHGGNFILTKVPRGDKEIIAMSADKEYDAELGLVN
jgi:hypothetical protein